MRSGILYVISICLLMLFIPPVWGERTGEGFVDFEGEIRSCFKEWLLQYNLPETIQLEDEKILATPLVREFYCGREFKPAWITANGLNFQGQLLFQTLLECQADGLKPGDYHVKKIHSMLNALSHMDDSGKKDAEQLAALDAVLTDAFFLYAIQLNQGRVDPRTIEKHLPTFEQNQHWPGILRNALESTEVFRGALANLGPKDLEYTKLRATLAEYRRLEPRLTHLKITGVSLMQPGDRDALQVTQLRSILNAYNDLPMINDLDPALYTQAVEAAVKHFQQRHGLKETGEVDEETLFWLNLPIEERIHRLEINMERWRWLPLIQVPQYIKVNIPAYMLTVIEQGKAVLNMRVVVGQKYRRTPVFGDQLRTIVLNPVWEIPPEIIVNDKLGLIRSNPEYFENSKVEVYLGDGPKKKKIDPRTIQWKKVPLNDFFTTYHFRQLSSPTNPLGRVKFMFPNPYDVYLHDTLQRDLFEKTNRYFSSGCIRLEQPIALAEYCLREERLWTRARIKAAIEGKIEQKIKLTNPIIIYILYYTAWVDEEGLVHFCDDIYKRDLELDKALNESAMHKK